MATLIGKDGTKYEGPDENVAEALASGEFTLAPAAPSVASVGVAPEPPDQSAEMMARIGAEHQDSPPAILVEKATGRSVDVPEDQADALVAAGTHTVSGIPLVGAEDGKLYYGPDANIPEALQSGQFRLSTLAERNQAAYDKAAAQQIEQHGITGAKPLVGGAVDTALGFAAKHNPIGGIIHHLEDRDTQAIEDAALSKGEEEHPIAADVGAVGGEATTALGLGGIAGGVSKAAGLAGAAKLATEGAIFSAEPVAKAVIDRDPAGAAEALALGVGLNFGLHGVFSALESTPKALGDAGLWAKGQIDSRAGASATLEEQQNQFGKALGLSPAKIAENREALRPLAKAAGITSDDIVSGNAIKKIQALENSGPAIGKAIRSLDTVPERAGFIADSLATAREQVEKLMPTEVLEREALEAKIATSKVALKEAATTSERLAARGILDESQQALAEMGKLSPDARQAKKALDPILDQIEATSKRGSFEETQRLKSFVRGQTNFAADNGNINALRKRAYGVIAENLMAAEDKAATSLGTPEVIEGLRQQRAAYTFHKLFGDAADRAAAKALPENEVAHLLTAHRAGAHSLPIMMLHMLGLPSPLAVGAGFAIPMLKSYAEKQSLGRAARAVIGESVAPSTNTVLHALSRQKIQIDDSVRHLFSALGNRATQAARPDLHAHSVRELVPEGARALRHNNQVAVLRRAVNGSPDAIAAHLGTITADLHAEGLQNVAAAYVEHTLRLQRLIQATLPPDRMTGAHPFAAKQQPDEISKATRDRYERVFSIATDPTKLLSMIHDNTITPGDVAIAAAINPSALARMRRAMVDEAMRAKPDTTYQQRISIGILLGEKLDESTATVPVLQQSFATSPQPQAPKPHAHRGGGKAGQSNAASYRTASERLVAGG